MSPLSTARLWLFSAPLSRAEEDRLLDTVGRLILQGESDELIRHVCRGSFSGNAPTWDGLADMRAWLTPDDPARPATRAERDAISARKRKRFGVTLLTGTASLLALFAWWGAYY